MTPAQLATQAALAAVDQAEATIRASAAAAAQSPSGSPPSPRMLVNKGKKKARQATPQQGSLSTDLYAPVLPPRLASPVMATAVSPGSSPSGSPKRQRAPPQQRAPSAQLNATEHFLLQAGPRAHR